MSDQQHTNFTHLNYGMVRIELFRNKKLKWYLTISHCDDTSVLCGTTMGAWVPILLKAGYFSQASVTAR